MWFTGVDEQNVAIVTDPPGTPVDGQPNTFDYPILTNVTLMCVVTAANGSLPTVTSYSWNAIDCYNHSDNNPVRHRCFYDGGATGQNITGNNLQAPDAGTITCSAIIGSFNYTSEPLMLRISGELCRYVNNYV